MLFLVNGPSRTKRRKKVAVKRERLAQKKRTKVKARRSASPLSKTRRMGAKMAVKRKKATRRRKTTVRRARPAARKKRRATARKRKPVTTLRRGAVYQTNGRKRRRSVRRNPSFSAGGILSTVKRAGVDALAVLGGMAATNFISRKIPYGDGNRAMEVAKKVAIALGLGMIARKASGAALAEKIVVGGMVAVGIDLLRDVPTIGTALAGDSDLRYLSRGVSAYPTSMLSDGMGSWPQPAMAQAGSLDGYYN
jgi:hypothetical protein